MTRHHWDLIEQREEETKYTRKRLFQYYITHVILFCNFRLHLLLRCFRCRNSRQFVHSLELLPVDLSLFSCNHYIAIYIYIFSLTLCNFTRLSAGLSSSSSCFSCSGVFRDTFSSCIIASTHSGFIDPNKISTVALITSSFSCHLQSMWLILSVDIFPFHWTPCFLF